MSLAATLALSLLLAPAPQAKAKPTPVPPPPPGTMEAKKLEALKAEVVIYAIGIGDQGNFGINEGMLKRLSEATGGRVFVPKGRRDLENAFVQLEQDMRQQYLLAYEPSNEALDGSFRKLEIKVPKLKDNKDIKIRHRKGYYAPKG